MNLNLVFYLIWSQVWHLSWAHPNSNVNVNDNLRLSSRVKRHDHSSDHHDHNHQHEHLNELTHDHITSKPQPVIATTSTAAITATGSSSSSDEKKPDRDSYIRKIFDKYGENGRMTFEAFEHLLEKIGLEKQIKDHSLEDHRKDGKFVGKLHKDHTSHQLKKEISEPSDDDGVDNHSHSHGSHESHENDSHSHGHSPAKSTANCASASEILRTVTIDVNAISEDGFKDLCPIILYKLDEGSCYPVKNETLIEVEKESLFQLWLYGAGAVIFISITGLGAIMMIPMIQNHHGDVIQLLVGLAIGTLTSDALLHLLPHAFTDHNHSFDHDHADDHQHSHADDSVGMAKIAHEVDNHTRSVIYGLMSLMGIIGFLIFERVLTIISDLCSQSHRKTSKIANCNRAVGEKLSNHNLTADLAPIPSELEKLNESMKSATAAEEKVKEAGGDVAYMNSGTASDIQLTTEQCHRETIVYQHPDPDRGFVVQLTDHHHHHQKQHQKGPKSVVMMIVTGDGMHNFFDGLAIGVAFAGGGLGGGLSTSVAILCHELPHEVGDFAVLLNAGLSTKRAVMYNTLSAVLCFIGMTVGVIVGKMDTGLLSAIIAGMFLYIALVNMIPQLDCCPTQSGTTRAFKLSVQLIGISIGVAIMCAISIYETNIQTLLS